MTAKTDPLVAEARRFREEREKGYREKALKLYPWICGRCRREFDGKKLKMLTVHHRDHNHDNNPPDGSNWELLCLYCHDNEHARFVGAAPWSSETADRSASSPATYQPFANLKDMLKKKE